jgi:hypothetical protein
MDTHEITSSNQFFEFLPLRNWREANSHFILEYISYYICTCYLVK